MSQHYYQVMKVNSARIRGWQFYVPNPEQYQYNELYNYEKWDYVTIGKERGPGHGTLHLHGYIFYNNKISKEKLKELFPYAKWIPAIGTPA